MLKKLYLHVGMRRQGAIKSEQFQVSGQSLRVMLMKITEQLSSSAASGTPGEITEHPSASSQSPKLL